MPAVNSFRRRTCSRISIFVLTCFSLPVFPARPHPRCVLRRFRAVRALALLRGRESASLEEVKAVAPAVLRHRVIPNYNATGEGITVEDIVAHLLARL